MKDNRRSFVTSRSVLQASAVRGTAENPENPMSRQDIIDKTRDLITPVLGAAASQKLIDKIFAIERVKNVVELRPLLQSA